MSSREPPPRAGSIIRWLSGRSARSVMPDTLAASGGDAGRAPETCHEDSLSMSKNMEKSAWNRFTLPSSPEKMTSCTAYAIG